MNSWDLKLGCLFNLSFFISRLVQQPNCVKVPKEVCVNTKKNPRRVKKPVVKEWCYRPKDILENPGTLPEGIFDNVGANIGQGEGNLFRFWNGGRRTPIITQWMDGQEEKSTNAEESSTRNKIKNSLVHTACLSVLHFSWFSNMEDRSIAT